MSSALKSLTPQEYLNRERKANFKSEFLQGEMFAMAGGSPMHSLIAANFVREAGNGLKGKSCKVFNSDLRVKVLTSGLYTYPDASVICGDLQFDDDEQDTVTNPTVLVEVLSDSTEKYDLGTKSRHYRSIESLQELLLISQHETHVEQYIRQTSGGWLLLEARGSTAHLELTSLCISIQIVELYRSVTFQPQTKNSEELKDSPNAS